MKKSLMLVGALMISTIIFAQNDDAASTYKHRGDGETMKSVLSLDDKQDASVKEINKKYHEKQKAMWKDLQDQRESEITKVLTPEQNTKWKTYRKERMDRRTAMHEKHKSDHGKRSRGERHHHR